MFEPHLGRFMNSAFHAAEWRPMGISLQEIAPTEFRSRGGVQDSEPNWYKFSRIWNRSSFAHFFNIDLPLNDQFHIERFVRAILALRRAYWSKTSVENPFYVVILPYPFDTRLLRNGLENAGISFVDYSRVDWPGRVKGSFTLPGEIHPTAEAYDLLATAIDRDLGL